MDQANPSRKNTIIILAAVLIMIVGQFIPAPMAMPEGEIVMTKAGWATLALVIAMAMLWITEAIPIYATALIPIIFLPLANVLPINDVVVHYANKNIYLFMGGFFLAIAMEKWQLHRRIALNIIRIMGTRPDYIILGFMITVAFLSMWISNTAAATMMVSIGISIIAFLEESRGDKDALVKKFAIAMMLSIAFAASLGGVGTLIGTPPNAILASFVSNNTDMEISFAGWMVIGVPVAIVGVFITWIMLTKVIYRMGSAPIPGIDAIIKREYDALPPMSRGEKLVALMFFLAAFFWITRSLWNNTIFPALGVDMRLDDAVTAISVGVAMFMIPVSNTSRILEWKDTSKMPWGILILFGGGLALGAAIASSGVGIVLADSVSGTLHGAPAMVVVAVLVATAIGVSTFASNTATVAAFLPIFYPLAAALEMHPLYILVPITVGASCVFILPSATPPNAIVMASERLRVSDMARAGSMVNVVVGLAVTALLIVILKLLTGQ